MRQRTYREVVRMLVLAYRDMPPGKPRKRIFEAYCLMVQDGYSSELPASTVTQLRTDIENEAVNRRARQH
jgi:hypothetical protein